VVVSEINNNNKISNALSTSRQYFARTVSVSGDAWKC